MRFIHTVLGTVVLFTPCGQAGAHLSIETTNFDYTYPADLIAQHPAAERSASRLLVLDRRSGACAHRLFADFPDLIQPGDVLVINTSKVIPARLTGVRDNGRLAEVLLIHEEPDGSWLVMVHPGGKLKTGRQLTLGDDATGTVVDVVGGGLRRMRFAGLDVATLMERHGAVPLPPYIERPVDETDRDRYQTIYAREDGSVAAPTAGLHFTTPLLDAVRDRGAEVAEVVLHIGPGTFKPVEVDDPSEHVMHAEWYAVSESTAETVNNAKAGGHRIWAVGTTTARALETVGASTRAGGGAALPPAIVAGSGWTDLFIHHPYTFRVVDRLLTNFHLPRSTLLMLVAAFAGYEHTMAAYREAVAQRYRLYSYGDAMAIV